jgi:hypothetical protein
MLNAKDSEAMVMSPKKSKLSVSSPLVAQANDVEGTQQID